MDISILKEVRNNHFLSVGSPPLLPVTQGCSRKGEEMKDNKSETMTKKKLSTAVRGALIYAVIGGLWILFSDKALESFTQDVDYISLLQTYKGWFYVLVTSALLFILLKRAIENTERLLSLDPLTQLPRHYQFTRLLDRLLINSSSDKKVVLIYLDLCKFSQINQEFGHRKGDAVLQKLTGELWECFHENGALGRLGSDQFGIAVKVKNNDKLVEELPDIVFRLTQRVGLELKIPLKVCQGLAIAPYDGKDSKSLLSAASIALHNAKKSGDDQCSFFSHELSEIALHRQRLITELKSSEVFKYFRTVYQPQLSIADNTITGVEVLIRWIHPELGFISPEDFIPIAEDIGAMPNISRWVITNAKKELNEANLIPDTIKRVSINISARELNIEEQAQNLHQVFKENLDFASICQIEITETTAIYDISTSQKFIESLKELGLKFSIDDFGTGFTSLSNLKNLPVDELKIDRSFIDKIETENNSQIIVKSVIDLANNFGINSIAEGVENENQLEFLKNYNCDEAQGYYFAKPMGIDDLRKFVDG